MQHYPFIVIGAGLAGANAANTLLKQGHQVLLVDKARGTGGRASSKRLTWDDDHVVTMDMGVSAVQAKSAQWQSRLNSLQQTENLDLWFQREGEEFFCGRGRNSMVTRTLAQGCETLLSTRVQSVQSHNDGGWILTLQEHEGEVYQIHGAQVIITAPAQQAADMLPNAFAKTKSALSSLSCYPSFVTLVVTKKKISSSDAIMKIDDGVLCEIVFEHSKPYRDTSAFTLLKLQSSLDFTLANLEEDKAVVGEKMTQAAEAILGPLSISQQHTHRWLYSQYADGVGQELIERDIRLSSGYIALSDGLMIASDYVYKAYTEQQPQVLHVSDAESACLSGIAAAEALLETQLESA